MNKLFNALLLSCMLFIGMSVKAQGPSIEEPTTPNVKESPHLLLEMTDGEIIYTLITKDLKISHASDYVFNIITEKKQSTVDLSNIKSLGILYMEPLPDPDPEDPDPEDPDPDNPDPEDPDPDNPDPEDPDPDNPDPEDPDPDNPGGEDSIYDVLTDGNQPWYIVTVDGVVISQGVSGRPDLSGLQSGCVYIIKIGDRSYKYLNLK